MMHPPSIVKPEAFGIAKVAMLFGVSESTVRNWIRRGELKAFRAGRKLWRVSLEDLRRFKAERQRRAEGH